MKQNSAEQPYEAYERLKKELEEVNESLDVLQSKFNYDFMIYYTKTGRLFNKIESLNLTKKNKLALIEVLESKKQQIENELNNLVNGI